MMMSSMASTMRDLRVRFNRWTTLSSDLSKPDGNLKPICINFVIYLFIPAGIFRSLFASQAIGKFNHGSFGSFLTFIFVLAKVRLLSFLGHHISVLALLPKYSAD